MQRKNVSDPPPIDGLLHATSLYIPLTKTNHKFLRPPCENPGSATALCGHFGADTVMYGTNVHCVNSTKMTLIELHGHLACFVHNIIKYTNSLKQ